MKKLEDRKINVPILNDDSESDIKNYLEAALYNIPKTKNSAYVMKINVNNLTLDQVHMILKDLNRAFKKCRVNNCIFIPISNSGIKDITIEEVNLRDEKASI